MCVSEDRACILSRNFVDLMDKYVSVVSSHVTQDLFVH